MDDQTVCAIAGFFSWSGPSFPGLQGNPLPTAAPAILNEYIELERSRLKSGIDLPLLQKFEGLADAWETSLNVMLEMEDHPIQNLQASTLIVAGYEGNSLEIGEAIFKPITVGDKSVYVRSPQILRLKPIGTGWVAAVEGYSKEVREILLSRGSYRTSNPAITSLESSEATGTESELSLDELRKIASALEDVAATAHPLDVGGEQQVAVLTGGRVSIFENPVAVAQNSVGRESFAKTVLENSKMSGGGYNLHRHLPSQLNFYVNDSFRNAVVAIDGAMFLGSEFDHCTLFYDGSPVVFFGRMNQLEDTDLLLAPKVKYDSPTVKKLKSIYPNISISRMPGRKFYKTHSGIFLGLEH